MQKSVIFRLSESQTQAVRFLSGLQVSLADGKTTSWITLTRTGSFTDPRYGSFDITNEMLLSMVANFHKGTYGQDIVVDLNHDIKHGAAADIKDLAVEGNRLRAQVEWTPQGIDAVKNKRMKYLSAEFHPNYKDNENGNKHGPTLLGAALTVRPVIKHLDPVELSEQGGEAPLYIHPELIKTFAEEANTMKKKYLALLAAMYGAIALSESGQKTLSDAFGVALGESPEEATAKALLASFEDAGKKLAEAEKANPGAAIQLTVEAPATGMSSDDVNTAVTKALADRDAAAVQLTEDRAAKVKTFADTINASKGLSDDVKKKLCEDSDLITADMSDAQVKKFAERQIAHGNDIAIAQQLSALGYVPQGSTHVQVGESGDIKTLTEHVDARLGIKALSDAKRYKATGGVLSDENKELAEQVLGQFDRANAMALADEARQLAAGNSGVSDVVLPISFERAVIREALYQLKGTQLVDVGPGVAEFAAVVSLPYSYRDTSAAGKRNIRRYQGQAIANAGVIQTTCEARPIPQKLGFLISDELRYLMTAGKINWDAVSENRLNASRIIAEDSDMLIHNELLDASDEFTATAIANEIVAGLNGVLTTFPLANFPVVRPRLEYDLKGTLVGSIGNAVTVLLAAAAITEYDGTGTQAAGNYYSLDYNAGEITVVNEAGVAQAHAAGALDVSYSAVTNVARFDTDLGALLPRDLWDNFMTTFAGRKDVIQDDRFHTCDFSAMSGTSKTQIEQARSFVESYARNATDLAANGDLGRIKDVPTFRVAAPGIALGDQRIIMGERGSTKFRISKAWSMNQLENQRDNTGAFTGEKASYGDQFVILKTPDPLKRAYTSVVFFSTTGRVAR